jgi:hypothetical protein
MKLYFTVAALLLVLLGTSSCTKKYDCTCTVRGTQSTYVKELSAQNGDDARDECVDYQDNLNATTIPGVDCDIQ